MKISSIIDMKDKRVAITPETTKKYVALGLQVVLPDTYGVSAGFSNDEYISAGASIGKNSSVVKNADIYLCVKPSFDDNIAHYEEVLHAGSRLIGMLSPFANKTHIDTLRKSSVILHALELIPRITRAQSMDVLSSQANISGYRAMIEGICAYSRIIPLMMTAAGTVRPAKVLIIGAGVAGLQAIATAKRLGAVVSAFDVRAAAKEQVESLGAAFVSVGNDENGETTTGYAKEMSEEYKKRQAEKLQEVLSKTDIVVTTAQIPGKAAPLLITNEMVKQMPNGSVIVDMSTETGGNCECSVSGSVIQYEGKTVIGYTNFASMVCYDASQLFARNVLNFVSLMYKDNKIDDSDEIVKATTL